ncbi:MAG: hypothetical protein EU550_03420 [Promethearchaeota archaeon]|nr:MAG: hypothetical protein EU550_03420 [Candidatus Lokiarchaeota archaeon]
MARTESSKPSYEFLGENQIYNKLGEKPRNYIKEVVKLLDKKIGLKNIETISLFGSQISNSNECCSISDCDLLIVVKNSVPGEILKKIEPYLLTLEIKHNYRTNHSSLLKQLTDIIQLSTGMFVSHFLTKEKFCKESKFYKMFRVSEILSYFIAPKKLVLNSVLKNNHSLYGRNLNKIFSEKLSTSMFEMIRSLIMNISISLFSLLILPFKFLEPIKYQLEAIKWTLRAVNYYIFEDAVSLPLIINRFSILENNSFKNYHAFYRKFLYLRENPIDHVKFMISSPFRILKFHIKGIKMRNHALH